MQARLGEAEAAQGRVAELERDNADLSKRLVELKMTEIERMNEARPGFKPASFHTFQ